MKKLCEICGDIAYTDNHHIQSKSKSGSNKAFNRASLCKKCHDLVHRGEIILEGRFMTSNDNMLIFHNYGDDSITGREPDCYIIKSS